MACMLIGSRGAISCRSERELDTCGHVQSLWDTVCLHWEQYCVGSKCLVGKLVLSAFVERGGGRVFTVLQI